jgi:hypothetical protein
MGVSINAEIKDISRAEPVNDALVSDIRGRFRSG